MIKLKPKGINEAKGKGHGPYAQNLLILLLFAYNKGILGAAKQSDLTMQESNNVGGVQRAYI